MMNIEKICYVFDVDFHGLDDAEANFSLKVENLSDFHYEKFTKLKLIAIRAEKRFVVLAKVDGVSLKESESGWACEFSISSFCIDTPPRIKTAILQCTSTLIGLDHIIQDLESATFPKIRPEEIPLRLSLTDAVSAVACKYGVNCHQVFITISSKTD